MAFESVFWRKKIKGDILYIKKKLEINLNEKNTEQVDQIYSEIEIKLFTIAYSLRKLMDTKKFPDCVEEYNINITRISNNGKKGMHPWHLFEKYYDLNDSIKEKMCLRKICNQFIHSYYFQPMCNYRHRLRYIFFVSDFDRKDCIYMVNIKYFFKKILSIVDKYPDKTTSQYNKEKDEWIIESK